MPIQGRSSRSRFFLTGTVVFVVAFLTTACGTRVERQAAQGASQAAPASASPEVVTSDPGASVPMPVGTPAVGTGAPAAAPAAGTVSGGTKVPAATNVPTTAPGSAAGSKGTPSSPSKAPAAGQMGGGNAAPGTAPSTPGAPAPTGRRSPIAVAIVGTLSGPLGALLKTNLEGTQIWIKHINGKGGVNGHEVRSIIYDDGADPAKHRAAVRDAVERQKVIAFLTMVGVLTGQSSVEYLASKRVPVVGADGGEFIYASPMHFPQATALPYLAYSLAPSVKQLATGAKKVALLTCTEAQVCRDADRIWAEGSKAEGLQVVYRAQISLAQPDFTAECFNAQSAGAEVILYAADTASLERTSASCARQDYRPTFATMSSVMHDRLKEKPDLEGLIGTSPVFPYIQSGTPATDEFQSAMKRFLPNVTPGVGHAVGWVAGKLFEKATAALPEPPVSEAILQGLWSLKDETLNGLTSPLNFVRDKPAPPTICWFNMVIHNKAWTSPDNFKSTCRPVTGK